MAGSNPISQHGVSVAGDTLSFRFALVKKISAILSTCGSRVLGWPAAIFASTSILLIPLPASAIYVYYGDSKYTTVVGPTWEEAQANAVSLGGNLVTINDAAEEQFLLNNTPGGWIGYTDRIVEGVWEWVDGTPKGYERWDPGSPSNNWGQEHYAYLDPGAYFSYGGGWNDIPTNYWTFGNPFSGSPGMGGIAEIKLGSGNPTANVPGPLPILGLAAAFCFSRKLRKRIKLHRGTSDISASTGP